MVLYGDNVLLASAIGPFVILYHLKMRKRQFGRPTAKGPYPRTRSLTEVTSILECRAGEGGTCNFDSHSNWFASLSMLLMNAWPCRGIILVLTLRDSFQDRPINQGLISGYLHEAKSFGAACA